MIADIIVLIILVSCAVSGYRKGIVMSLFSLLTSVIACFIAVAAQHLLLQNMTEVISPLLTEYVISKLPEAGALGEEVVVLISQLIAGALLFVLAFSLVSSILHTVALALNLASRLPILSTVNHLVGGALGVVWGILIVLVALMLLGSMEILPMEYLDGPLTRFLRAMPGNLL